MKRYSICALIYFDSEGFHSAERFLYDRQKPFQLQARMKQIHGKGVSVTYPRTHRIRHFTDGKQVVFKVVSLNDFSEKPL